MGARDGWGLSTSGKIAAGAIGAVSALLPISTFVSVLSGASVADVVSTIHGKMITPLGLAHAGIVIKRKDWIGYSPIIIINVYAAATTTESPAALLRAAVNGGVAELQAKEDVYYHREPKKVEAATTAASAPVAAPVSVEPAASAPVAAPVVGDAAVSSIPATVPLISEPAVSSPVAAPVSVESAASAPAPAQVVSDVPTIHERYNSTRARVQRSSFQNRIVAGSCQTHCRSQCQCRDDRDVLGNWSPYSGVGSGWARSCGVWKGI